MNQAQSLSERFISHLTRASYTLSDVTKYGAWPKELRELVSSFIDKAKVEPRTLSTEVLGKHRQFVYCKLRYNESEQQDKNRKDKIGGGFQHNDNFNGAY